VEKRITLFYTISRLKNSSDIAALYNSRENYINECTDMPVHLLPGRELPGGMQKEQA
jgi:hypothetical protein